MAEQRPIGYWLKLVDRLLDERFTSMLEEHGVTRRQWQLLNLLGRGPASREELDAAVAPFIVSAADSTEPSPIIEADVATDPTPDAAASTIAELDELIESDWVVESPSGFVLTPRGKQSFDRLSDVVGSIRAALTEGFGSDEYDAMLGSLERMARNLGWSDR